MKTKLSLPSSWKVVDSNSTDLWSSDISMYKEHGKPTTYLIFLSFYPPSVASITFPGVIYLIVSCKSVTATKVMAQLLPIYLFSKIVLLVTLSLSEMQLFPGLSSLDLLHCSFPAWMFMFAMIHDFNENKLISIKPISNVMSTVQLYYSFKHSFHRRVVVHTTITWFYCTRSGITHS